MNEQIFRKKSLDRVKSPESLDDYIRVSNPSVWLILIAITVLLVGACIWGAFGNIESTVEVRGLASGGVVTCTVDKDGVEVGMPVRIGDTEGSVTAVNGNEVTVSAPVADGGCTVVIVTESIKPLSFVLN